MRLILVLGVLITLVNAVTLEQKASTIYKYFCKYDKRYCNVEQYSGLEYVLTYNKYLKQLNDDKKLKSTEGLNLPPNVIKAFKTLELFEYNNFPKYKLSESILPNLKISDIVKSLKGVKELNYNKLPKNIKNKIIEVNSKYYTKLVIYEKNHPTDISIFRKHYGTLTNFVNELEYERSDLSNIINASWEVSLATFLKAAKYAKKVTSIKKAITSLSKYNGYVKAIYQYYKIVYEMLSDPEAFTSKNLNEAIKLLADTFEMLSNATELEDAKLISLIANGKLQYEQHSALLDLKKYYKNDKTMTVLLDASLDELDRRLFLSISEIVNEISKLSLLSEVEGIGDAISVSNALIQAFTSITHSYHKFMFKISISDKYFKERMNQYKIYNDWIVELYEKLYPVVKFNSKSTNRYYLNKQERINIFIAGFDYEDDNRVDKCTKVGDFYKALNRLTPLYVKDIQEYTNKHGNENMTITDALFFIDTYSMQSFSKLGNLYKNRYMNYQISPFGNTDKKYTNKHRFYNYYNNLKLSDIVKRQYIQMQGFYIGTKTTDMKNLNRCIRGYKSIDFLYNYKKTIDFYFNLKKEKSDETK